MRRKLTIFGMLGSLAYVIHVILGGMLWKGYSHLMHLLFLMKDRKQVMI